MANRTKVKTEIGIEGLLALIAFLVDRAREVGNVEPNVFLEYGCWAIIIALLLRIFWISPWFLKWTSGFRLGIVTLIPIFLIFSNWQTALKKYHTYRDNKSSNIAQATFSAITNLDSKVETSLAITRARHITPIQRERILREIKDVPKGPVVVTRFNVDDEADSFGNEVMNFLREANYSVISHSTFTKILFTDTGKMKTFSGVIFMTNAIVGAPHAGIYKVFRDAGIECLEQPDETLQLLELANKRLKANPTFKIQDLIDRRIFEIVPTNTLRIIIGNRPVR
jgi:hypothetical protein